MLLTKQRMLRFLDVVLYLYVLGSLFVVALPIALGAHYYGPLRLEDLGTVFAPSFQDRVKLILLLHAYASAGIVVAVAIPLAVLGSVQALLHRCHSKKTTVRR